MCDQVCYRYKNKNYRVTFDNPSARLPLLLRNGQPTLLPWGRHKQSPGQLPLGSLIPLSEIYSGKWAAYFPRPVKLPLTSFLVRNVNHHPLWFHLPPDKWVQGLVAQEGDDQRVYIITLTPDENSLFPHWPRILLG